jgi:hypothetical protein
MVSDTSYQELHDFAARIGAPPRAFDRDHYDVPSERYADAVAAGAVEVGSKELGPAPAEAPAGRPGGRRVGGLTGGGLTDRPTD